MNRQNLKDTLLFDSEVEKFFDISTSKLRTAQRQQLISSSQKPNKENRFARAWSLAPCVERAYLAHMIAEYLALPFHVTVAIVANAPQYAWENVYNAVEADDFSRLPTVILVNREFVTVDYPSEGCFFVGTLTTDHDGRQLFLSDRKPFEGNWSAFLKGEQIISICQFNSQAFVPAFRKRAQHFLDTRQESA